MRRVNAIVWGVLLAFGAFVVHESLGHNYYGSDFGPGPGFFSFWLGILLMAMSLGQIVMTYRRPASRCRRASSRAGMASGACCTSWGRWSHRCS